MEVQSIIDDINAELRQRGESKSFEDSALIRYINRGLLKISDALEFTRTARTFTPDSNNRVYLPANAGRIEYVGRNGIEIKPLTPSEAGLDPNNYSTSIGNYGYLFINGYLQFGGSEKIVIHYIEYLPAIDNVNQSVNIRPEYREPIISWVVYKCFFELGVMDKAAASKAEFDNEIRSMRETIRGNAFKGLSGPRIAPVEL